MYNNSAMIANQTVKHFISFINKFSLLNEKERLILRQRLEEKTLKKIGRKFKVSAERIRQIEQVAIAKLKQKYRQLALFE